MYLDSGETYKQLPTGEIITDMRWKWGPSLFGQHLSILSLLISHDHYGLPDPPGYLWMGQVLTQYCRN